MNIGCSVIHTVSVGLLLMQRFAYRQERGFFLFRRQVNFVLRARTKRRSAVDWIYAIRVVCVDPIHYARTLRCTQTNINGI